MLCLISTWKQVVIEWAIQIVGYKNWIGAKEIINMELAPIVNYKNWVGANSCEECSMQCSTLVLWIYFM